MSRSIHETRKMLDEIKKYDFGDNWRGRHEKRVIQNRLEIKRGIKSCVKLERNDVGEPAPPTPLDQIPIVVRDEGPYVHYPATPEDVRALMHRLPPGSCDKLRSVEFTLERSDDGPDYRIPKDVIGSVDPYIGRFKVQRYPGVYDSGVLGVYNTDRMRIQLYGYVYAPELPNRPELELILKCLMLSTFVHEIAHHQDRTMRIARGRWRMDCTRQNENYAERWQSEWDCDYVVPFVQETYPEKVNRLLDWLETETDIHLTLPMLFGVREDPKDIPCFVEIAPVIKAIADHKPEHEIRKIMITEIYRGDLDAKALEEIDRLLSENGPDHELFTMKGNVLRSQKKFDAAHEEFCRALAIAPTYMRAWDLLVIVNDDQKNWPEAVKNAEHAIALYQQHGETGPSLNYFLRAVAKMEMGDLDGAEAAINETEAVFSQVKSERIRVDALIGIGTLRKGLQKMRGEPNKK